MKLVPTILLAFIVSFFLAPDLFANSVSLEHKFRPGAVVVRQSDGFPLPLRDKKPVLDPVKIAQNGWSISGKKVADTKKDELFRVLGYTRVLAGFGIKMHNVYLKVCKINKLSDKDCVAQGWIFEGRVKDSVRNRGNFLNLLDSWSQAEVMTSYKSLFSSLADEVEFCTVRKIRSETDAYVFEMRARDGKVLHAQTEFKGIEFGSRLAANRVLDLFVESNYCP